MTNQPNRQRKQRAGAKPPQVTQLRRRQSTAPPPARAGRGRGRGSRASAQPIRDLFDPRNNLLVPTVVSEGAAFPISGSTISNHTINTAYRTLLVCTNTGVAGTVMAKIAADTTIYPAQYTIPLLSPHSAAGGPTSGRAMKGGLTLCNRTQKLNQGGQVSVLNAVQRVSLPAAPSSMTQAQWNDFFDSIVAHPKTKIYNGSDFNKSKTFVSHPLDETDYLGYSDWQGSLTMNDFWDHVAVWPGSVHQKRPMSTIFVVFEAAPVNNTYEAKTRSSFYTRWPLDSVPGQAHRAVPTAPANVINNHRDHAEANAHVPRGEEAAVGLGAAAAGGGAAWLFNAARAAQAGAMAVGEGLELAAPLLALA